MPRHGHRGDRGCGMRHQPLTTAGADSDESCWPQAANGRLTTMTRNSRAACRMFDNGELRLVLLQPDRRRTAPRLRPDPADRGTRKRAAPTRPARRDLHPHTLLDDAEQLRVAARAPRLFATITPEGQAELDANAALRRFAGAAGGGRR